MFSIKNAMIAQFPGLSASMRGILTSAAMGAAISFSGDSFMASAYGNVSSPPVSTPSSSASIQFTNNSPQNWLRYIFRDRFYTDYTMSTAVGGMGLRHLVDTQLPLVQKIGAPINIVNCGTNDNGAVTPVLTASQMVSLARDYVMGANAVGTLVMWLAILPQSGWSAAQRQKAAEFNRQMALMARDPSLRLVFIDLAPTMVDYSSGNIKAAYVAADGVHLLILGWQAMAIAIQPVLEKFLPPAAAAELLPIDGNDAYDAVLCPTGNMHPGGMFTGSYNGGWAGASAGAAWYATALGTATFTPSKGTDATLTTLPTQIVTLGGTADGGQPRIERNLTPGTDFPVLAAGDQVYSQIEINASGLANVRSISLVLTLTAGGVTKTYIDGANANVNGQATGNLPAAYSALLRTNPMTLEGPVTAARCYVMYAMATGGGALAGVVAHSRISIRKAGLLQGVRQ